MRLIGLRFMVKIDRLSKYFGAKKAVSELSFSVNVGDVLGFIGPNGAGKSTTMRVITGFIPASTGSVFIGDVNLDENPLAAKSRIGYLPENAPLYSNKSVSEFLHFIASVRGFSGSDRRRRVGEVIERCFLQPVRNQLIDTLSKGYKHRTCFAQAILHDPEILVLDEPTDGLDPNQKREIRRLIREMGEKKAIILSTHILEEVEAVTNKVLLISDGEKVFEGTPEKLKRLSEHAGSIVLSVLDQEKSSVFAVIEKVKGVDKVESLPSAGGVLRVRISHSEKGPEKLSQDIMRAAGKEKWRVSELKVQEGNLEEVFAKLTNSPTRGAA
ncbi:MAG: ATP-binding cassette domain-containing protein [Victivallales bacterium]|nr:ATP-binding cassette domain-containing protein [Victivallales bacterium]